MCTNSRCRLTRSQFKFSACSLCFTSFALQKLHFQHSRKLLPLHIDITFPACLISVLAYSCPSTWLIFLSLSSLSSCTHYQIVFSILLPSFHLTPQNTSQKPFCFSESEIICLLLPFKYSDALTVFFPCSNAWFAVQSLFCFL